MHKRIAQPNLNDRGALVGSFFNVGNTLTHIGDNLPTQNKPKKVMQNRNSCPQCVTFYLRLQQISGLLRLCTDNLLLPLVLPLFFMSFPA